MAPLVTVAELRGHMGIGSVLPDSQLEILLDAADADIIRHIGPHDGEITALIDSTFGRRDSISSGRRPHRAWLPRPAATIASVEQYYYAQDPDDADTVEASEYSLIHDGWCIQRHDSYWWDHVMVTYTPISTNAQRKLAILQLVELDVHWGQAKRPDPLLREKSREAILRRLLPAEPIIG